MLGIRRNAPEIDPGRRAGLGHVIVEIDLDTGFLGAGLGGGIVARPVVDDAEFLVGNGVEVVGVVECADILADRLEGVDHRLVVRGFVVSRSLPRYFSTISIMSVGLSRIEMPQSASFAAFSGLKRRSSDGQVGVGNALLHHVDIVGDADGTPHVGNAIDVAWIPPLEDAQASGSRLFQSGSLERSSFS